MKAQDDLTTFLSSERVGSRTDDDRTLIVAVRQSGNAHPDSAEAAMIWRPLAKEMIRCIDLLSSDRDPDQVITFGPLATGQVHRWSHIDLVVIEHTELPFWKRSHHMRQLLHPPAGTNILIYTPVEFRRLCRERPLFRQEVLAQGKVLYERDDPTPASLTTPV